MDQYKAFIDGGSRGNPGPSASAFVLSQKNSLGVQRHIITKGKYVGHQTNNVAEYEALSDLVLHLMELGRVRSSEVSVAVYCDSLLVVNQVRGIWRTKDKRLGEMRDIILGSVVASGMMLRLFHIPREKNTEADKAVNRVLDQFETLSKDGLTGTAVEMEWDHPLTCSPTEWDSKFFTNL